MSFNPTYPHSLNLLPPVIDSKNSAFTDLLLKARTELAELKGYSFSMPNPMLLISPAVIKESVASSNIENINTTIIDVLQNQLFPEAEQTQPDKEVLRYRDAVMWGFENLKKIPVSTRLITGVQNKLIPSSHGNYRKTQNQIVNSTTKEVLYTPPEFLKIPDLIGNWEKFVNQQTDIDPLIKCAVAHCQFEAIHPFEDGNGRTGRILMVLSLIQDGVITLPILYVSGFINNNRGEYYRLLRKVTVEGDWNGFILFMLKAFYVQAAETKAGLFQIMTLYFEFKNNLKKDQKKIYSADLVDVLFSFPIITPVRMARELGLHYTTASRHLLQLAKSGFLKEQMYGKYHLFINERLIKIMKK